MLKQLKSVPIHQHHSHMLTCYLVITNLWTFFSKSTANSPQSIYNILRSLTTLVSECLQNIPPLDTMISREWQKTVNMCESIVYRLPKRVSPVLPGTRRAQHKLRNMSCDAFFNVYSFHLILSVY